MVEGVNEVLLVLSLVYSVLKHIYEAPQKFQQNRIMAAQRDWKTR